MPDAILINNLKFQASIGVYDWEKTLRQDLALDLTLHLCLKKAGQTDDLTHTLDYAQISSQMIALANQRHYNLIECLATDLLSALFEDSRIERVQLTLRKPGAVAAADSVGVYLERHRDAR